MLKNKQVAWSVTVVVMILSVFIGATGHYRRLQADAQAAFDEQIMPALNEAMVPAFNMQTVAANYLSAADIDRIGVATIVDNLRDSNGHGSNPRDIFDLYIDLNRAVWAIYDRLAAVDMSEQNRTFITNFHAAFNGWDVVLTVAGYNNIAADFNAALQTNLGFIARPFVGVMPRFDN